MSVVGIDLGTTNSLISVYKDGTTTFIPNEYGEILTPSVVSIDKDGETIYVGKSAKNRMIEYSDYTASQFKRSMGTNRTFKLGKQSFDSEELSSLILKKLVKDAENYMNEEITEAVISVPAYFNENQRRATKRAGELAGLKVERLVNEPSAAALMSRINDMYGDKTILIFDFGGGTLDVSYAECFENIISVLAISGNNKLGGRDFDRAIAKYFCLKNELDFNFLGGKEKNKLLFESEQVKIKLSNSESVEFNVELSGKTYYLVLTREDLVNCTPEIFQNIEQIVKRVFRDAEIETDDIDEVILVGGSSKMPVVQQYIRYLLPTAKINMEASDTIVGMGVGTYAGIKSREKGIENLVLTDICPFSLGTSITNDADLENH
ncbi:Hsp70 family protein [Anaerosporobacter sp.]